MDINDRNGTALLLASSEGKFDVAQLLIWYEGDVNSTDGVGWTPFQKDLIDGRGEERFDEWTVCVKGHLKLIEIDC